MHVKQISLLLFFLLSYYFIFFGTIIPLSYTKEKKISLFHFTYELTNKIPYILLTLKNKNKISVYGTE